MEGFFEQLSKSLGINLDPRMIRSEMLEILDSDLALRVAAGALSGANNAMVLATDDPTGRDQRSIAQGKTHLARGWMELHDRLLARELRAEVGTSANLGLASDREMLQELECRARIVHEDQGLSRTLLDIQEELDEETLNYRTVQSASSGNGAAPVS